MTLGISRARLTSATFRTGIALAVAIVSGCAQPEVPQAVPEPTSALRPEAVRGPIPADARIADYELEARLDAEEHTIDGTARVTWRNTTTRTVTTLPFHLYMNGFRAEDTAWMRSSQGRHRDSAMDQEGTWGYIDVHSARLLGGNVATDDLSEAGPMVVEDPVERPGEAIASPEDLEWREDADPSTMTVTLPRPVGPGETVTVEMEFLTQLPKVVARTGYFEDFHAIAQWYPKIGVLEEEAGWQAHTFTFNDEFYADFGNYHVEIDVPEQMIVGASGVRTGEEVVEDGRKRLTYSAEMVHDFAWFADPDFVEYTGEHRGIRIRQLIQPELLDDADDHQATQVAAIDSYEARFGPYPWSTITIVHPPEGAEGAGGMEYPTLFTTDDRAQIPDWIRSGIFDERLTGLYTTIHEFGHQYFQGLFATREHLEPWLDEGMNSYSNYMALYDHGGPDAWLVRIFDRNIDLTSALRLGLGDRAFWQPVDRPAATFNGILNTYGRTIYVKTSAVMVTLRNLAGADDFDRALAIFSERARFGHPRGSDLDATLVAELGEKINLAKGDQPAVFLDTQHYLDQALRTTRQVNFTVQVVDNRRLMKAVGWRRTADGLLEGGEPPANIDAEVDDLPDEEIEGVVAIRRAGEFVVPVEVRVELADGSVQTRIWDAVETTAVFTFPGQRVDLATVDPDDKLALEWQRIDNTALAADLLEDDGISLPVGDMVESLTLALLGSLGP